MSINITLQDVQKLLAVAGVTDSTGQYSPLGGGEGNDTFLIECSSAKLILRVARYSELNKLAHEARALSLLNLEHVPRLIYFDNTQRVHDRAWILESYLDGAPVEHLTVRQFESLGELLAKVHGVHSAGPLKLDFWEEFLSTKQPFGDEQTFLNYPDEKLRLLIRRGRDYFQSLTFGAITPSLTHGDVSLGNMLVRGNTISLIDWEYARFTDPMADFSALFYDDMAYNKGRWRIHITQQDKSALFAGYTDAGGVIDERHLKAWQNFDKLGNAVYLYWKINHSGHTVTQAQAAQYGEDLDKLTTSLERNL